MLSEAFSGGRTVPVNDTFGALVADLEQRAGSGRAAARAAGIPESTWRGWKRGLRRPGSQAQQAARRGKLLTGIRGYLRVNPPGTRLTVTVGGGRARERPTRNVDVDRAALERAGDAWQRGDLRGMVREFRAGITDTWYRTRLFRPQDGDPDDGNDAAGDEQDVWDPETSEPYAGSVSW